MSQTVVGLYDTFAAAQKAVDGLTNAGFDRDQINILTHEASKDDRSSLDEMTIEETTYVDEGVAAGVGAGAVVGGIGGILAGLGALFIPGIGPIIAAGPIIGALAGAGIGVASGGVLGGLVGLGIPKDEAEYYAEALRRGGTLVTVQTDESAVPLVTNIMNRYDPTEVDQRAAQWRASGWQRFDENGPSYTTADIQRERDVYRTQTAAVVDRDVSTTPSAEVVEREGGTISVPIIEETMNVGKRAVQKGGVRVHKVVQVIPVEESVSLREEHLTVERRPVDRVVGQHAFDQIETGTVSISAMAEKAVVSKEARVVEEVVIQKDVLERTEHISDTVRRTEVEVQEKQPQRQVASRHFDHYDTHFRTHFDTHYSRHGGTYNQYQPAYRYGYDLRSSNPNRTWAEIEPEARRKWEEHNPSTWEQFKNSVQHAWNNVTN